MIAEFGLPSLMVTTFGYRQPMLVVGAYIEQRRGVNFS